MKITTVLLSVVLFAFTACSQNSGEQTTNESKNSSESTAEMPIVKRVSKTEFKAYLADSSNYVLIDVRTPREFNGGTIDGAININSSNPNFQAELAKLDKTKPVLMFCQSGGRSGRALPVFKELGFQYVLELEGGFGRY